MVLPAPISNMSQPLIRRPKVFDKLQYRMEWTWQQGARILNENKHLMNKIVKINTTEKDFETKPKYEKKSLLKQLQKLESEKIKYENTNLARRIETQ